MRLLGIGGRGDMERSGWEGCPRATSEGGGHVRYLGCACTDVWQQRLSFHSENKSVQPVTVPGETAALPALWQSNSRPGTASKAGGSQITGPGLVLLL